MDPQQLMAQGREMIVEELNIGHLPEKDQTAILSGLGEVLLRRVLLKLLELMPETERDSFGKMFAAQDSAGMQVLVEKHVPNANDVIKAELRAGIEEHKRLVAEDVAKQTASAPAK